MAPQHVTSVGGDRLYVTLQNAPSTERLHLRDPDGAQQQRSGASSKKVSKALVPGPTDDTPGSVDLV